MADTQEVSKDTLLEKYCKDNESTQEEIFKRVAKGIASVEKTKVLRDKWEKKFYQNMVNGAIGAGRIMGAAGTSIQATLNNCYVQGVGDSIQDQEEKGYPGIYIALKEAAETMRRGGGVGYDFSRIRPKNAEVKGTASFASGPCSYIDVFDISCQTVESAGSRRGAQLASLRIDHPDIELYVVAKRTPGRWNNFNVSVFVTDEFMEAVKQDKEWELVHKAKPSQYLIDNDGCYQREDGKWVYKKVKARDLWDTIMKSNYDFAEPGILFGDNINNDNNLRYTEVIEATNPCGEEPLPPYGCCDLGPIILPKFVKNPFTNTASFDFDGFKEAVAIQVRFLDNVLDVTHWPLEQQKNEAMSKRRIGVGFTGLGNVLAMLGAAYNSQKGLDLADAISKTMRDTAYIASVELAKEKGAFPLLDTEKYLEEGTFASRLPDEIKAGIRKYGIRNSHLTSIAPTGTVSLAFADNASNGIEPPFSLVYMRKKRLQHGGHKEYAVMDHGLKVFLSQFKDISFANALLEAVIYKTETFVYNGSKYNTSSVLREANFVTALEMSVDDHLAMMAVVQPYIDASISKTVNVPADYPFEDFKKIYDKAHELGLKGVATYRPNSILGSVLSEIKPDTKVTEGTSQGKELSAAETYKKFITIDHAKRPNGKLAGLSDKYKYFNTDGDVKFYVGISFIENVIELEDGSNVVARRPIELFINSEMNIGNEWGKLLGITLSHIARTSIYKLAEYLKTCQKMRGDRGSIRFGFIDKPNGSKAARYHGSDIAVMAYAIQNLLCSEGILDKHGDPVSFEDLVSSIGSTCGTADTSSEDNTQEEVTEGIVATGAICPECGAPSVIKKDGCKFCTNCGAEGSCG